MSASSASSLGTDALAPGTELIVDRLAYRHHGIYLGEGLVIHYAGRIRCPHGLIETVPLRSFVGKRRVQVGRRPAESLHGEAIVRRARSRLGERRYAIFSNNCEHFCSWCQVGESRSKQVDRLLLRIRAVRCAVCPCGNRGPSLEEGASNGYVRWRGPGRFASRCGTVA